MDLVIGSACAQDAAEILELQKLAYQSEAAIYGFELFTGHKSERNLYLYHELGYGVCRRQRLSDALTIVFPEREASPPGGAP